MTKIETLEEIAHEITNCLKCPLGEDRMQHGRQKAVPGTGAPHASIFFLAEKPGKYESDTGEPFAGKSGDYLRQLLRQAGVEASDIFITNVVCCQPPENRSPETEELEACMEYTFRQIELIDPDIIVTVGAYASKQFIDPIQSRKQNMGDLHGIPSWAIVGSRPRIIFPTYHPAAGFHNLDLAPIIEEDFLKLGKRLKLIQETAHAKRETRVHTTSIQRQEERSQPMDALRQDRPNPPRPIRIIEHTSL